MVIAILAIAALYALPNIYGEDYAVQISASRNATVNTDTLGRVEQTLEEIDIAPRGVTLENDQILVRVNSDVEQLQARDALLRELGTDYIVALNLAPATPEWLASIGAEPMKLGLDLRGGVHFLMEVDMQEAVRKIQDQMRDTVRSELREERIRSTSLRRQDADVGVELRTAEDYAAAEQYLDNRYPGYTLIEEEATQTLRLRMTEAKLKETQDYAISQNVTILRNRVNELGVAEP